MGTLRGPIGRTPGNPLAHAPGPSTGQMNQGSPGVHRRHSDGASLPHADVHGRGGPEDTRRGTGNGNMVQHDLNEPVLPRCKPGVADGRSGRGLAAEDPGGLDPARAHGGGYAAGNGGMHQVPSPGGLRPHFGPLSSHRLGGFRRLRGSTVTGLSRSIHWRASVGRQEGVGSGGCGARNGSNRGLRGGIVCGALNPGGAFGKGGLPDAPLTLEAGT